MSDHRRSEDAFGLSVCFLAHQVEVAVNGELDEATAPDLGWLLAGLLDRGHTQVVLDLAGLASVDNSGLHVITPGGGGERRDSSGPPSGTPSAS